MTHDTDGSDIIHLPSAIAIIGMAGRFPGARNLEEFRRNLENGVESITVFSDSDLLKAGINPKLLANPNYVKAAPLLEDADQFDASFFEYSPREAIIMDPQQRLFLECAWEALEDAGHAGDVSGSMTGVFSGAGGIMSTYLLSDTHFNPELTGTTASMQHVGNDKDYLSTRVSYKLNLRGPSLTVQTACSTSLVAIHLACQSLLTGESDMALAGGTTVRVPQRTGYLYKEGNVFSRDGHCRAFDADATGTVFGSGIGVIVLKRLRDALRDRDAIRAVIRATAINNDGSEKKTSYWAPHAPGQADAMRRALTLARVDPSTIGYVEAHGTATMKGDPTEIRALSQAFGPIPAGSCAIGSVKSNIGHPESAAGVAGVIKAVMALEHNLLFPSLHYSRPNPEIDGETGFYVNATRKPWASPALPRRAAVNSLGIGGTNAFAILEEAPPRHVERPSIERPCHVMTLSAKSPEALEALSQRFKDHLQADSTPSFGDICYTANVGRAHFSHRLAMVACSAEEAVAQLPSSETTALSRQVEDGRPPRVAFLFTGQGSQYTNMGRELYETHPGFRDTLDRCAQMVSAWLEQPLIDVLYPDADGASPINETAFTQPALFAVEYALAMLWRSWGVEPSLLVGHSVGEIVAACVAGVIGLGDALRLTAARGRLMQALPRDGGMAAVRCSAARAAEALAPYRETVAIAAINGPSDIVISGRLDHIDAVVRDLEGRGIPATRLKVSHAFHSPLMDPMLVEFAQVARSIRYSPATIPVISNVTGSVAGDEIGTPDYWVRHVRESVRFADGIVAAHAQSVDVFLEVGPSPVLIGMARQSVPQGLEAWLPSLRPGRSNWQQIAESLAALYVRGADINWAAFDGPYSRSRVHLPTYPFQRQRYWMDPPAASALPTTASYPALLGQRLRLPLSSEIRFETRWSPHAPAYLNDHRIFDTVVVPGASHIAMVLSAMREVSRRNGCLLDDIVFPQALTFFDDGTRTAQLILTPKDGGETAFQIMTLREGEDDSDSSSWVVHATGKAVVREVTCPTDTIAARPDLAALQARCTRTSVDTQFYDKFWEAGYHLAGAFRWISRTWAGDGEILCELNWPDLPDEATDYALYPSLIDACFQSVFSDRASALLRTDAVYVPFSIRRFVLDGSPSPGTRLWCHATVSLPEGPGAKSVDADITLYSEDGRVVAVIEGCQLREVRREALLQESQGDLSNALYEIEWQPLTRPTVANRENPQGLWIVLADRGSRLSESLIDRLRASGQHCVQVDHGDEYASIAVDRYLLNGVSPEHMQRLLEQVIAGSDAPLRGIVHLWSLDAAPMDDAASGPSRERAVASVLHLVQALARVDTLQPARLWLVTRGAQAVEPLPTLAIEQAPVWGLGRVIALEHPELACTRVDLDPNHTSDAQQLFEDIWSPDEQDQLAYRGATRYVPRLVRSSTIGRAQKRQGDLVDTAPFQVKVSSYGHLDNLVRQPFARRAPGPGEVELQVRATGLNFRDVLNALGLLQAHYAAHLGVTSASQMTFGFECAGTVVAVGEGVSTVAVGDDVIATATHEALASFVTLPAQFVVRKPTSLTFEEAASLPLAFLTAYYGLHHLAKLQPGERVLIHSAAGGVGQACVQWARYIGAEIFATASPTKWDTLKAAGVGHVMSSRTLDFAATVSELTNGTGVDVVVNTLSGEFVDRSFDVLRSGGRFIELGKRGVWSPDQAQTRRPDVAYFPFDLVEVAKLEPTAIADMLREMVNQLEAGALQPLPRTVFPVARVADAFRYMAEARHIGKIVVTMPVAAGNARAPFSIRSDATYLITGGLGALGLEVATSLVDGGARHIVLTSRRPPTPDAEAVLARLRHAGATVLAVAADLSDQSRVARLLSDTKDTSPPLRGIVHAAGVLDDGVLLQQTWERFRTVMAPKVDGAWHLHALTRDLPLDFFVCFSSVASLVGNAGQGNYASANAFMDALAHFRSANNLAGLSINWGPWGEVGMAADASGQRQRRLSEQGFRPIARDQGVAMFSRLLGTPRAQIGVVSANWSEFVRVNATGASFFERVAVQKASAPKQESDIRTQLERAPDPRAVVARHVRSVVGKVLGVRNPDEIDSRARLFDLGLESLMAVEMRGRFEESLGCSLRPTLLFDYPTIEALADHLTGKVAVRAEKPAAIPDPADTKPGLGDELSGLGEEAIADQLARELMAITQDQRQ